MQRVRREDDIDPARMAYGPTRRRSGLSTARTGLAFSNHEVLWEQLTWAKQRALICVDMGGFTDASYPATKRCADTKRRWTRDAALGRGSQALTEWIEGFS
jgi:hypothetical protein